MHVNHSQINSSKKCGFENHETTEGFHSKTARQNRSKTDNHHLRQSLIWQLSLCGNYTLIFDPEEIAPYNLDWVHKFVSHIAATLWNSLPANNKGGPRNRQF